MEKKFIVFFTTIMTRPPISTPLYPSLQTLTSTHPITTRFISFLFFSVAKILPYTRTPFLFIFPVLSLFFSRSLLFFSFFLPLQNKFSRFSNCFFNASTDLDAVHGWCACVSAKHLICTRDLRYLFTMDQSRVPSFEDAGVTIKKRRSQTSRRPRPEAELLADQSPMSSTLVSDDVGKVSSDENTGETTSEEKMFNLNQCLSRSLPVIGSEVFVSNGESNNRTGSKNIPKKVKLKLGGVTRTIQTKSNGASGHGSPEKIKQSSDNVRLQQKLICQENSNEYYSPSLYKKGGLQGIPWKDFSKGGFSLGRETVGRTSERSAFEKQVEKSDSIRKSKRVPKKHVLDEEFDEDDDDEIRYLEKLKTSKISGFKDLEAKSAKKCFNNMKDVGNPSKDVREFKTGDLDHEQEEESMSDGEPEGKKKRKQTKDLSELPSENKREMALTTRQRALLSKDAASASGASQIEFPNGLPPPPPRKQKEKLTEVEEQLKKVEAAQRRRMQNEKTARESEAEAIRKILGQDSSRKKREGKMKKRREELAQEKTANAQMLASNTIRWILSPTGTTVTFPLEMGLPKFFDFTPRSYPPPRENCVGPCCSNPFKYRDSKWKLPLCSLKCYKAINEKM